MSLRSFFVLFCQKNSIKPILYKTKVTINKHLSKNPELSVKRFYNQDQASQFLRTLSPPPEQLKTPPIPQQQQVPKKQQLIQPQEKQLNQIYQSRVNEIKKHPFLKAFSPAPLIRNQTPSLVNLFFDGSSRMNPGPSSIGYVAKNTENKLLFKKGWGIGIKTNNQAEFCALAWGLFDCVVKGIPEVNVFGDSQLVINIMTGMFKTQNPRLQQYRELLRDIEDMFLKVRYTHIDRSLNSEADGLAKAVTDRYMRKI